MIDLTRHSGVACLHLAAAERGNALSSGMVDAMLLALQDVFQDDGVHTLLLTGAGQHLCTGFDLSDLERQSEGDLLLRFVRIEQVLDALWRAPIRTVAYASGRTWGAGADLFAACDLRWAAPQTRFRFPGAGFGLVLGTRRLSERVGTDRARDWVALGIEVDAPTSLQAGLVSAIHPPPEADPRPWLIDAACRAPAVDRSTQGALRAASRPNAASSSDTDLAALVRSAARPGLKDRISAYSARARAGKGPPNPSEPSKGPAQ